MRVALIAHTSLYWTGLYARHLIGAGHDVVVISFGREPLEGVEVDYVGRGTPVRWKSISYLMRAPRVRSRLRSFGPDAVLATYLTSNGLIAALAWPRALVVSAHGTDVLGRHRELHQRLLRFVCNRATLVHAVSEHLVEVLAAAGVPADRVTHFPIGVDTEWFAPSINTRDPERPPHIICTRHHEAVYDNETIVTALAFLRDRGVRVEATFFGGGSQLPDREQQVAALGLQDAVSLVGRQPLEEIRRSLRVSDVYVSASRSDGTSSSLLEAMSCGVFPVVTSIPSNRPWIEDGVSGLFFEPGNARSLATALERALADSALRATASELNRARVLADGDLTVNMRRMETLLQDAAAMSRS